MGKWKFKSYVKNDFTGLIGKNNYVVSDLEY